MIRKIQIIKLKNELLFSEVEEKVVIERPLEILISKGLSPNVITKQLAVTMRTPGNDHELCHGFLYTEGIIQSLSDIESIHFINEDKVEVRLSHLASFNIGDLKRRLLISSSCGICGKASLDDIADRSMLPWSNKTIYKKEAILNLPCQLSVHQDVFNQTGGLHAAALFDVNGSFVRLYEDIGRHNALDKLIGSMLTNLNSDGLILLSGRSSFEMIQKTSCVGVGLLVSIGPPSSMAIELAEQEGITLIGFLKEDTFNIYSCPERII